MDINFIIPDVLIFHLMLLFNLTLAYYAGKGFALSERYKKIQKINQHFEVK